MIICKFKPFRIQNIKSFKYLSPNSSQIKPFFSVFLFYILILIIAFSPLNIFFTFPLVKIFIFTSQPTTLLLFFFLYNLKHSDKGWNCNHISQQHFSDLSFFSFLILKAYFFSSFFQSYIEDWNNKDIGTLHKLDPCFLRCFFFFYFAFFLLRHLFFLGIDEITYWKIVNNLIRLNCLWKEKAFFFILLSYIWEKKNIMVRKRGYIWEKKELSFFFNGMLYKNFYGSYVSHLLPDFQLNESSGYYTTKKIVIHSLSLSLFHSLSFSFHASLIAGVLL